MVSGESVWTVANLVEAGQIRSRCAWHARIISAGINAGVSAGLRMNGWISSAE